MNTVDTFSGLREDLLEYFDGYVKALHHIPTDTHGYSLFIEDALEQLDEDCGEHLDTIVGQEIWAAEAANLIREMFDFWCPLVRPYGWTEDEIAAHKENMEYLKTVPQYAQRTTPWYKQTYNMLTGSEGAKIFATPGIRNGLIRSKCILPPMPTPSEVAAAEAKEKRIAARKARMIQDWGEQLEAATVTVDARGWGQRYEPVVKLIHTARTGQTILEFGRIPHRTIDRLGASPDGIEAARAKGIEIKSVVSRTITGEVSFDYAVQMQMQMACCGLKWIEFIETKFSEYELMSSLPVASSQEPQKTPITPVTQGVIWIVAVPNEADLVDSEAYRPLFYVYSPPFATAGEIEGWEDEMPMPDGWKLVARRYWNLEIYAPQYVAFNEYWFDHVFVPEHKRIWEDIEHYRLVGCESIMPAVRKATTKSAGACPVWDADGETVVAATIPSTKGQEPRIYTTTPNPELDTAMDCPLDWD